MIDEATVRPTPKNIVDALHVFSPLSELQQTIQLVSHSPLQFSSFSFFFLNPLGQSQESQCATITMFTYFQLLSVVSYHIGSTRHQHGALP